MFPVCFRDKRSDLDGVFSTPSSSLQGLQAGPFLLRPKSFWSFLCLGFLPTDPFFEALSPNPFTKQFAVACAITLSLPPSLLFLGLLPAYLFPDPLTQASGNVALRLYLLC